MTLQTAGVFVLVDGRVAFQAGPDQTGQRIGLVRIGGHLAPGETPTDCARREAREEASLTVEFVDSPTTYCLTLEGPPRVVPWADGSPRPLHASATSQVFLAVSEDTPTPASETRGLILLSPEELIAIRAGEHSLASLERSGAKILLRDPMERDDLYGLPVAARWAGLLGEVLGIHPGLSLWGRSPPLTD